MGNIDRLKKQQDHLKKQQFIYPEKKYLIITHAKILKIDKDLGSIIEERSYLYCEQGYWRILKEEIVEGSRRFDCIESTLEDWLAIKNTLFPPQEENP